MRRVLKDTGSIYLHCDPTASHYLKLLMDAVFGRMNFRNEVAWGYRTQGVAMRWWPRKHDTILFYTVGRTWTFAPQMERQIYAKPFRHTKIDEDGNYYVDTYRRDIWDHDDTRPQISQSPERLGYPTQKPLALLERIIKASSNEGDTVLDPFCGCGTTVHAAESLHRKWIGIDISKFSTGLIRDRILHNFKYLNVDDIDLRGTPDSVAEARALARQDPFEFEKWVCGYIGAEGMFREPGEKGADGGVDGVLKFFPVREGKKVKPEYAIVQVKGGNVSPDAVKALHETVRRYEATAGVMVCFADQLGTVENQRVKATFSDAWGSYPVVQGFSVESLLSDGQLDLPLYGYKRRGAMLGL